MQHAAELVLEPIDFTLALEAARRRFMDGIRRVACDAQRAALEARARQANATLEKMSRGAVHAFLRKLGMVNGDARTEFISAVTRDGQGLKQALVLHLEAPVCEDDRQMLHHLLQVLCHQVASKSALGELALHGVRAG